MRMRNLGRAWSLFLLIVVTAAALACGGAAEAPASAMTEAEYAQDSAAAPEFAQTLAAPAAPAAMVAAATLVPVAASQESDSAAARPQQPQVSDLPQAQSTRKLIVEAWTSLEVTNIDAAVRQVEALAVQSGGWVESSQVHGEAGYRSATVRIRVPAERLDIDLDALRALGRVVDEGISSTDVTERLIDNEARLTAWYAQEERLVTLLENAPTVEDIIQIEKRIAEVRSDIEQVEATQRDLTGRVATSLITVNLRLPSQYAADPPNGTLRLSVGDPSAIAALIMDRVDALGGYVGQKRESDDGNGRVVDMIVFVKPADLSDLMDYAATLGASSGRQLSSVGPNPINEIPNARFTLGISSNVDLGAFISLRASDPMAVAQQVRAQAESNGGFVERWEEHRNDDEHRVNMDLVVRASELRSIMDFAAEQGKLQRWDYNALGQNPSADAPNARLSFIVATEENYASYWIALAVIVGAAALVVVAVVVLFRGRRRSRTDVVGALEPDNGE